MNFLRTVALAAVFSVAAIGLTAMVPPVHEFIEGQIAKSDGLHLGKDTALAKDVVNLDGYLIINNTKEAGTVALASGTPSTATVTVRAGARCFCFPQGATAAIAAAGCATSLSGTTLTLTGPNTVTTTMGYFCF